MIESRCGILCSECDEFWEKKTCKGCIAIDKPCWGECAIKKCCKEKNIEHCGLCGDFPCDMLVEMSHDEEVGDNGKRIEQCKIWASAK